jgi:hypothetical protein
VEARGPVPGPARARAGARASGGLVFSTCAVGRAGPGGGGRVSAGRWVFRLARSASCRVVCAKNRTPLPLETLPPPLPARAAAAAGRLFPAAAASLRGSSPAARAELTRLHAAARRRRAAGAARAASAASAAAATPVAHRRRPRLPSRRPPTERAIPCPFKSRRPESLPPSSPPTSRICANYRCDEGGVGGCPDGASRRQLWSGRGWGPLRTACTFSEMRLADSRKLSSEKVERGGTPNPSLPNPYTTLSRSSAMSRSWSSTQSPGLRV